MNRLLHREEMMTETNRFVAGGTTRASARVGFIVEQRYLAQLQPSGMIAALKDKGCEVETIDPEAHAYLLGDDGWIAGLDLIACRGRSDGLLALLRWAETRGVRTVNGCAPIMSVLNKAQMSVSLAAGNVPSPAAFLGPVQELAASVPKGCYPVILKPIFGDNCRGLRIVSAAEELSQTDWPEPVALAQHFVASDGHDLKLYGIGEEVWAVRKASCLVKKGQHPFAARADEEACLVPVTEEWKTLARRCAEIFGLELYGVDCIETDEGLLVIEINDFPNYTGVPGADEKLADYVLLRAREEQARRAR
jgi:ribosomal protein S6--L-glutamate ligase